jgi:hypothetical protein
MNRCGKRLALGVMTVGLAVVLVLAIAYRKPILDHLQAWRFQLTTETETIETAEQPHERGWWIDGKSYATQEDLLRRLESDSGIPVVMVANFPWQARWQERLWKILPSGAVFTAADSLQCLRAVGWHVLEQRFPRRAYVVLSTEDPMQRIAETSAIDEADETPLVPSGDAAR